MDGQRKDIPDPKIPVKMKCSQQQYTYNVPTENAENTNSTNLIRNLLFEEQRWWLKRMRVTEELLHIDQHISNECKTIQKYLAIIWYDKLSENV